MHVLDAQLFKLHVDSLCCLDETHIETSVSRSMSCFAQDPHHITRAAQIKLGMHELRLAPWTERVRPRGLGGVARVVVLQ